MRELNSTYSLGFYVCFRSEAPDHKKYVLYYRNCYDTYDAALAEITKITAPSFDAPKFLYVVECTD